MSKKFQSPAGTTTTFILVRHAEKADSTPESPLSEAGRERARALVDALAPLGVTTIYCPPCDATAKQYSRCPNNSAWQP